MSMSFRTRKHGTKKQIGKKFPVMEKKKLPTKIRGKTCGTCYGGNTPKEDSSALKKSNIFEVTFDGKNWHPKSFKESEYYKQLQGMTELGLLNERSLIEDLKTTAKTEQDKKETGEIIEAIDEEMQRRQKSGGKIRQFKRYYAHWSDNMHAFGPPSPSKGIGVNFPDAFVDAENIQEAKKKIDALNKVAKGRDREDINLNVLFQDTGQAKPEKDKKWMKFLGEKKQKIPKYTPGEDEEDRSLAGWAKVILPKGYKGEKKAKDRPVEGKQYLQYLKDMGVSKKTIKTNEQMMRRHIAEKVKAAKYPVKERGPSYQIYLQKMREQRAAKKKVK